MSQFVKAQTGTLSNGIKVSHLHLPHSPKFNIILEVPVGSAHDPIGKEGLSHVLEHSVFCGTENLTEEQIDEITAQIGGGKNASTSLDTTLYDLWASAHDPNHYHVIADMMRQLVGEPTFPDTRINTELKVILNEEAEGVDDLKRGPMLRTTENISRNHFRSPNVIGTPATIRGITASDLKDFIRNNYDAAHMNVYSAGPLGFEEAFQTLEQTLGGLPRLDKPRPDRFLFYSKNAEERCLRTDLRQNYITLFFTTKPSSNLKDVVS